MIKIQALLSRFRSRVDRTLSFQVDTQELPPETKAALFDNEQKLGWLIFSPTSDVDPSEIPDEKIEWDGQKSLSQRLYGTLYVLHTKKGGKPEEFEEFRRRAMESIINKYKAVIAEYDERI